ncbi:MAG: hypothetical protein KBC46_03350 [Ferrovibrio sp.]|nr:hypothetical protein [Ferrovibrio sp.]
MDPVAFLQAGMLLPRGPKARDVAINIGRLHGALERAGYTVSITHELERVVELFQRRGLPLSPVADPTYHPQASAPDRTLIVLLERDGVSVGTTVQRRIYTGDLAADMRDLSFWYGQTKWPPPGTTCMVAGDWAEPIRETAVVYSCAFALAGQQGRKDSSAAALIRLGHAMALATWDWGWLFGRGTAALAQHFGFNIHGSHTVANGVWLLQPGQDPATHPHLVVLEKRQAFFETAALHAYGDPAATLRIPEELHPA